MKLLAIETSSDACSVALADGTRVHERHTVEARSHTTVLMPMIESLLAESGISLQALDAVVLGNGPGSFIGMRIGASVAQGICFAAGLKLIPVSSLAAIAGEVIAGYDSGDILVAQDAHMNEVYVGHFERGHDGLPVATGPERILPVGPLQVDTTPCLATGGAWLKYPQLLAENRASIKAVCPVAVPRARYLLAIAAHCGEAIAPELLHPAYLRTRVADVPRQNA